MPLLGCIADDATGATDLALMLTRGGMHTEQIIGVPDKDTTISNADAIVIALKTRTCSIEQAIYESITSANWLKKNNYQKIFFKYCSTFDSTKNGNIGPVADALLKFTDSKMAIICPAFPKNGRTIKNGILYIEGVPLSETIMRHHPLTPMTNSNLVELMTQQTIHKVGLISYKTVKKGPKMIQESLEKLEMENHKYAVIDALDDLELQYIGKACANHALITGGSGVALGIPDYFKRKGLLKIKDQTQPPSINGKSAVLAGSCSKVTLSQLSYVKAQTNWPHYLIDLENIEMTEKVIDQTLNWISHQNHENPLVIYSSSIPNTVQRLQKKIGPKILGELIEKVISKIALSLVQRGFRKLILAGGETSGAVINSLNIKSLTIGQEIDPGIPWTNSNNAPKLALALKSGNFGKENFFVKAFKLLK